MKLSAELARSYPLVNLHPPGRDHRRDRFCLERFGMRPIEYMESLGWLGDDIWFAHMVHPDEPEIPGSRARAPGYVTAPAT